MKTDKIPITLRLDSSIHEKVKYISSKELRSLNSQLEYFILKEVELYESHNGVVPSSE